MLCDLKGEHNLVIKKYETDLKDYTACYNIQIELQEDESGTMSIAINGIDSKCKNIIVGLEPLLQQIIEVKPDFVKNVITANPVTDYYMFHKFSKANFFSYIFLLLVAISNIIYWNFITVLPFDKWTAWVNISCFIGAFTLGAMIKKSFFHEIKNIYYKTDEANNEDTKTN